MSNEPLVVTGFTPDGWPVANRDLTPEEMAYAEAVLRMEVEDMVVQPVERTLVGSNYGPRGAAVGNHSTFNPSEVWVAGRVDNSRVSFQWEVLGVYTTEELAVARCSRCVDFVAPIRLNDRLPEETTVWPGCYYPLVEKLREAVSR